MKRSVIGIDVGKYELSLFWDNKHYVIKNDTTEMTTWFKEHIAFLKEIPLMVYEPTGGYERKLQRVLQANQWPHRRVHANHVRAYARAAGIYAKTDHIDARVIAEYAIRMEIKANETEMAHPALKTLLTRREQLIRMRAEEKNRLDTCDPLITKFITQHIDQLTRHITKIDKEIQVYEKAHVDIQKLMELYTSVPGVGRTVALQLIADLPELEREDDKKLAALTGLAPWNCDSGLMTGKRRTHGGRTRIRSLLYMSALVAARCCPPLNQFYLKLRQKGKAAKVALVAVAHKLLMILRSIAQRQTPWVPVLERGKY